MPTGPVSAVNAAPRPLDAVPTPLMSFATGESAFVTVPIVPTTLPTTTSAGPTAATIIAIFTIISCICGLSEENQFPTASIFSATVSRTGTRVSRIFSPSIRPAFLILLNATVASSDESMIVP